MCPRLGSPIVVVRVIKQKRVNTKVWLSGPGSTAGGISVEAIMREADVIDFPKSASLIKINTDTALAY